MFGIKTIIRLILLFQMSYAHSEELRDQWVIERLEEKYSTKGIKAIEIRNQFGDVRARGSNGSELQLYAVTQHHEQDRVNPVIQNHKKGNRLFIDVVYPAAVDNNKKKQPPEIDKRRIDIAVFVPDTTNLSIQTDKGFIESKGHKGQLNISTLTGNIKIVSKGMVNAHSRTGSISSTHKNRVWTGPSKYETQTGDIRVALRESPNVAAKVETGGTITTDYSIEITSYPGTSKKTAMAHIGANPQELLIKSSLGKVELSRIFDMIQSKPQTGNN